MNITSIKQQVKNPDRVSIFVDGKYTFSLSLDELVVHKLKNNDELSEANVKKFKKISEDGKLRARALEWLLNRPHSEREFSKKGYLDNAKFAEWFAELQSRRNKSNRAIRSELFKKGIDRQLTDIVMEEQGNEELERLKALIAKKSKSSRYKNDPLKLAQYLVGQGFNYQLVKQALAADEPED
jgi:regulatory protein